MMKWRRILKNSIDMKLITFALAHNSTAVFEYLVVFFCPLTIVCTSHYPGTAFGGTVGPCPFASTG